MTVVAVTDVVWARPVKPGLKTANEAQENITCTLKLEFSQM